MLKNSKEISERLLELFTSDDYTRPYFKTPFRQGDYVYATDTYAIVRIPAGGLDYPEFDRVNCARVYELVPEDEIRLSVAAIETGIQKIPTITTQRCGECEGGGYVEWSYEDSDGNLHGREFECPVCNGACTVAAERDVKDPDATLIVGGHSYRWRLLARLAEAAKIAGVEVIEAKIAKTGALLFYLGDAEGIIMNCLPAQNNVKIKIV